MRAAVIVATRDGVQTLYAAMPGEDIDYIQSRIGTFTAELTLTFRASAELDGRLQQVTIRAARILSIEAL